jgi:hypothetical protein
MGLKALSTGRCSGVRVCVVALLCRKLDGPERGTSGSRTLTTKVLCAIERWAGCDGKENEGYPDTTGAEKTP